MAQGSGLRAQGSGRIASSHDLNNLKKLSVIIPAYNTEKFLNKCVESVANQTYKNIEIIIVDDGSADNTPKICDELAAKYNNIKVIHQENQGTSWARRAGVEASTGEYIAMIDSDDYIDLNAYEIAIKALEENNLDMVQFRCYFVSPDGRIAEPPKKPVPVKCDNAHDAMRYFLVGNIYGTHLLWIKVYKRFLFEDIEWTKISQQEDACISVQLFAKTQKFMTIEDMLYYYLQRGESISHQSYVKKSYREDALQASEFLINFTAKNFPDLLPEALFHPAFRFYDIINEYAKLDSPEGKEVIDQFAGLIKAKYFRMQTELKKQGRKLDMGYDLKYARKKLLAMKLFAYCPGLIIFALKIYFKRHALSAIKK